MQQDFCIQPPHPLIQHYRYILVLDALNFCFFPTPGLEYDHLARGLKHALEQNPAALDAQALATVSPETVNGWLAAPPPGRRGGAAAAWGFPQLEERVRKVREVGKVLLQHFDGLAANLVKAANHSAEDLVRLVTAFFPGFRDECVYKGAQVFFYKRAQIFVGDVWAAYGKHTLPSHPFGFTDMHRLTMFADYRIPQILRARGVMVYAPALATKVDALESLPPGSEEEVEIRAATVQAVEELQGVLVAAHGMEKEAVKSVLLDWVLWQEGERLKDSLPPHHRTLTCWY